ncbi:MAG: ATP-binding cassette domain-containing protein [Actinomycetia bacterium]|nr:ATP-binding cassette domain-containing protein [Actinomycetes bacterium]
MPSALLAPELPSRTPTLSAAVPVVQALALTGFGALLAQAVDTVRDGRPVSVAVWVGASALIVLAGAARWAGCVLVAQAGAEQEGWQRARLTQHALGRGYRWLSHQDAGRLATLLTEGVDKHVRYRIGYLGTAIGSLVATVATVGLTALLIDPWSALWLGLLLPVAPLVSWAVQRFTRRSPADTRRAQNQYAAHFFDSVQGLTSLRLLTAHRRRAAQLAEDGEQVRQSAMAVLWTNQLLVLALDLTFALVLLGGAAVIALTGVEAGRVTVGEGLALVWVSHLLLSPVRHAAGYFYIGIGGRAAEAEIERLTRTPAADLPRWTPSEPEAPTDLESASLSFRHDDDLVLDNVDLTLASGSATAVIGPSGSGKSTLLALLQGMLEPERGRVGRVTATGNSDAAWLQRHTALVGQGATLLRGSVAQNLRLAKPDATDEELWQVLRRVGLADEIPSLDTAVGELGHGVSGGQAQRIAIARVLLADRPVLLLDEPTSSLDGPTEQAVLAALKEAAQGRTVVSVAHRASALDTGAQIYTLVEGRLR